MRGRWPRPRHGWSGRIGSRRIHAKNDAGYKGNPTSSTMLDWQTPPQGVPVDRKAPLKAFDHIDHHLLMERGRARIRDLKGDAKDQTVLEG